MAKLNIFSASAGSGKTYTLARRVIDILIHNPLAYRHILAVTFTNKATAEMKDRIVRDLALMAEATDPKAADLLSRHEEMSRQRGANLSSDEIRERCAKALRFILTDYSRFSVSTIDKFVQRVVRAFAYEHRLPANYGVETDTTEMLNSAVDHLMASIGDPSKADLLNLVRRLAKSALEEGKNTNVDGQIFTLGQQLLQENSIKITESKVNIDRVTALSDEMAELSERCGSSIYDCAKELSANIDQSIWNGSTAKTIVNALYKTLSELPMRDGKPNTRHRSFAKWMESLTKMATMDIDEGKHFKKTSAESARSSAMASLRSARPTLLSLLSQFETSRVVRKNIAVLGVMTDLANQLHIIESAENKRGLNTAAELLRSLIDECPVPFIYEKTGVRYDTIMIDEFQDTSRLQYNNFRPLLENSIDSGNDCLVVGDVKQSIYRFRSGDWRLLANDVQTHFDSQRHALNDNYRSRTEIVEFNNALYSALPKLMDSHVDAAAEKSCPGSADYVRKVMQSMYDDCAQTPKRGTGGYVRAQAYLLSKDVKENKEELREMIAKEYIDAVGELRSRGLAYSDICFLVQRKAHGAEIIDQLCANGYPVMSDDCLMVMNSDATRCLVDSLRFIARGESASLFSVVRTMTERPETDPSGNVTALATAWESLREEWAAKLNDLRGFGTLEALGELINMLPEHIRRRDVPYIEALQQKAREIAHDGKGGTENFLRIVDSKGEDWKIETTGDTDAIRIMTIHKSKGLEFKAVLIPYFDWAIEKSSQHANTIWCEASLSNTKQQEWHGIPLPIRSSQELSATAFATDYAIECQLNMIDNLNLAYVATTRPTEVLMTWGLYSVPAKSTSAGNMTRFVSEALRGYETADGITLADESIVVGQDDKANPVDSITLTMGAMPESITAGTHGAEESRREIEVPIPTYYRPDQCATINTEVERSDYERRNDMTSYGLTMHSIMEHVTTTEDIDAAVEMAATDGLILPHQRDGIKAKMRQRIDANPTVKSWFDGTAHRVWAETTMMGPDKRLRPDRIMQTDDGRTIIVDYKFGLVQRREHTEQVQRYMEWLGKAGFGNIDAYIWYYELQDGESRLCQVRG